MDYRRISSAHFQFLVGLCQISMRSVNDSLTEWLTSDFVTVDLLTPMALHAQLDSLLRHRISAVPEAVNRLLFVIRNTNHGTNYEYVPNP